MATDNSSSVPVQRSQYNSLQNAQTLGDREHEIWSNGHLPGVDSAASGPYPAMNYFNALPPTRHANIMGYDDPPHLATDPAEQRGNQSQHQLDGRRTPGITHYIPIGPPQFEQYYAPAVPEVPNDCHTTHVPLIHNIAGPSRGNPSVERSGISVAEDLKSLASHYLHNPSSHVDKFRMRRSRSGTVKVLIVLEIDDTT